MCTTTEPKMNVASGNTGRIHTKALVTVLSGLGHVSINDAIHY